MLIAFTPGEPAGIGLDLAIIYAQQKSRENLLIFSDPDILIERAKKLNLAITIKESYGNASLGELCVFPIKVRAKVKCGVLNPDNAEFVLTAIKKASEHCMRHQTDALCTGPVNKSVINQAGIDFTGHTEYLAKITNTDKTVMMLVTDNLRVALATTHLPLKKVHEHITTKSLYKTIAIVCQSLIYYGINKPKISICGLNPHAGEGGYLGREEIDIINPLINKLNKKNYNLIGAVPADTAFTADALRGIDAVIAMYHDQGLPIIKTLGFKKIVNLTLGLPFIRSSVDHGTAINLAGSGNISLGSLNFAISYTQTLINNGRQNI